MLVFSDYKKTSLYFTVGLTCNMKCMRDIGVNPNDDVEFNCHNSELLQNKPIEFSSEDIISMINKNPFTEAYIMSGLEPLDSMENLKKLIETIRLKDNKDIVIYTGYDIHEVKDKLEQIKPYENIVFKFGRFIPNQKPRYDDVLGVHLVSQNQYGMKI